MKNIKYPSVSFAIATYNSERTLESCLSSVRAQDYPSPVEIVIGDGGSTDNTYSIARKFRAVVISVPRAKQNAEFNKGVAVNKAKNEILALIDHDNILPHKKWLIKMVKPIIDDPKTIGTGVLRFNHNLADTILDRYFSLIGSADPLTFYLNKSAHQSWLYDGFRLKANKIKRKENYYLVELDPNNMPSLGGNGALVRRDLLLKNAYADPGHFFHIDVHVDLARKNFRQYAFVKETIIHHTNNRIIPFLKRRMYYVNKYYYEDLEKRRYTLFDQNKDILPLLLYIVYSITFIMPFYHAIRGYIKIRDNAWFLHPIMCFAMTIVYGIPIIQKSFYGIKK